MNEKESLCDYCGEPILDPCKTYSVPLPKNNDVVGYLCTPECQLSYSKFIIGAGHEEREKLMRLKHVKYHNYAPQPYFVKKYNSFNYIKRSIWLAK